MNEPQQVIGLYSPSRVGKCSNIGHKTVVFRKLRNKSGYWDLDTIFYTIYNPLSELEVKQMKLATLNKSPRLNTA